MEPEFPLALILPVPGSRRLQRSLHEQLRAAILDGRLRAGTRLPPTREFAIAWGVGRNTALAIYDLLVSEGYLVARGKAGTFVAAIAARARMRGTGAAGAPAAARDRSRIACTDARVRRRAAAAPGLPARRARDEPVPGRDLATARR